MTMLLFRSFSDLLRPLAVAGAVLCSAVLQPATPFRAGIDVVPVYATVIDKHRRLISDLSKDDFQLFDNGRPQPIALFSNDVQPISIVVMLDRSGSMFEQDDLVTRGAERFVLKLLDSDRARIGSFGWEILIAPSDFTSDHTALTDALRHRRQPSAPSPVWTAVDQSITAVIGEAGRRVVLLFSDGHDAPLRDQRRTDVKDLMRRAEVSDVMIYAIGVAVPADSGNSGPPGHPGPSPLRRHDAEKLQAPDENLRKLADISGGGYFLITWGTNLDDAFARIADELHHQYLLAFTPRSLDRKVHDIDVRVRQSGMVVRARKTYLAAQGQ